MRAMLKPGALLRLRTRFLPGHDAVRLDPHTSNRLDLPVGSPAVVLGMHATDIHIAIINDTTGGQLNFSPGNIGTLLPAVQRTDIWVPIQTLDVFFESHPNAE